MVEGTYRPQLGVAAKALPREPTGTRAGTDLPPELQLLVPGMLAFKKSEAGRHPHMTGPQDTALPEPCPLSCPGGRPAMALKQGTRLGGSLMRALIGQGHPGTGTPPL